MKETSLDDFASGSDEADTESERETTPADTGPVEQTAQDEQVEQTVDSEQVEQTTKDDQVEQETTSEQVEPATSTSEWSPDGTACNSCGEVVERLWVDEGDRVCEACKDWS